MTRSWSRLIIVLVILLAVGATRARRHPPAPVPIALALPAVRFIDQTGRIEQARIDSEAALLYAMQLESGIDVRVLLVRSTKGAPLEAYALNVMRDQKIGGEAGGRGLLILLDDSTKEARIEVGPHLEGVFPDAFVSSLLRDHLSPMFGTGAVDLGIRTSITMIHYRTREARLGGDYDPRAPRYVKEVKRLATGGGGSAALPGSTQREGPLLFPAGGAQAYFSPQPTVEAAYQRQLEYLALDMWPTPVRLFTPSSYDLLVGQPRTLGWNEFLLSKEYGYTYVIDERGGSAMLFYTGTPFRSPLFFRLTSAGWQMDIAAEVRNTQQATGSYLTWTLRKSGDEYNTRFADRYQSVSHTGFDEFYRVRGGDNRTMCVYGDPARAPGTFYRDSLCLAAPIPLADAH